VKKVALALAIGFVVALLLWLIGSSETFHKFNMFVIDLIIEQVKALIG